MAIAAVLMRKLVGFVVQDILKALDVAADVVNELSKLGQADQSTVDRLSKEFLDIVKVNLRAFD